MAERLRQRGVSLEYAFDRLFNFKLQQVYELLVPDHVRVTGEGSATKADSDEECSDLRPSLLYAAEGGAHHCQPDGSAGRLRSRLQHAFPEGEILGVQSLRSAVGGLGPA